MRIIHITLALLLAALALPHRTRAAEGVSVRAILVLASNDKGPADPKLAPYEAELQRNLPESFFRHAGEGSVVVARKTQATIQLGRGHRLEVEAEKGGSEGIRLKVQWMNGDKVMNGGTFARQPGVPVVFGRRPSGNGNVPIVLVFAE